MMGLKPFHIHVSSNALTGACFSKKFILKSPKIYTLSESLNDDIIDDIDSLNLFTSPPGGRYITPAMKVLFGCTIYTNKLSMSLLM